MERNQTRQKQHSVETADPGSGWRLFGTRTGERLRFFYLQAGLALLVLVTAGIFAAAAWFAPQLFGSSVGARRADAILFFCGVPAIVLAGIYFAFLRPRAVLDAYAGYARIRLGGSQGQRLAGESEERAFVRRLGVYWLVALLRLAAGAAFGAAELGLSRWLGARFSQDSWILSAIWTLCVVLFWQSRMPLALALSAASNEPVSGLEALRRGLRLYRRVRYGAINAAFRTLLVFALPLIGILALSTWISAGDPLLQYSVAAFLLALLEPPLRLLLAAFDTMVYVEATWRRRTVKRITKSARRLRTQHKRWKGQRA